jgi:plastocyanin
MIHRIPTLFQLRHPLIALFLILLLLLLHGWNTTNTSSTAAWKQRVISVSITPAGFMPGHFTCREGESITLMIVNTDTHPHNLVIEDLDVRTPEVKPGESYRVSFTAASKGIHPFLSTSTDAPNANYHGTLTVH